MKKLSQCLQHHHILLENDHKAARIFNLFEVKVKKRLPRKLVAVTTNNIVEKAVHVPIKYSQCDIIVSIPNNIEHHRTMSCAFNILANF